MSAPAGMAAARAIAALLLLSGAASLAAEVAWARALGIALGTSAVATAAVLAAFMGGMGAGALLGDAIASRARRPLAAYGLLEVATGLLGLAVPSAIHALGALPQDGAFAAGLAIVALPAVSMGATFPVACRLAPTGRLYATNTLGGVAGVVLTAFHLLPALGLLATCRAAALASLAAGLVALLFDRVARTAADADSLEVGSRIEGGETTPAEGISALGLAAAASGFAGLLLEVVLTRVLALVLGGTSRAFAVMLATFLAGIALGSALAACGRARRSQDEDPALAARRAAIRAAIATSAGALVVLAAPPELPFLFVRVYQALGPSPALEALLSALVLLPPALGLGATLTLLLEAAPGRTGRVYAANTAGSLAGALAGGLAIVPALGLFRAALLAVAAAALGAPLLARARVLGFAATGTALVIAAALSGALLAPRWSPSVLATGPFAYVAALPRGIDRATFASQFEGNRIQRLFHADGRSSSVTVERFPHANTVYLKNNGKVDGSAPIDLRSPSRADMRTQRALAAAPLLAHGSARRMLLVGLGGGVSLASALPFRLERIDVVEIEAEVARAVRETGAFDLPPEGAALDAKPVRPFEDPAVRLVIDDARRVLSRAAPGSYDVIASQPAEPWLAGVSSLFTREAFAAMRRALTPEGIACQWVQLYGLDREGLATLLATFREHFPEVLVLRPEGAQELLLLGSARPLRFDPAARIHQEAAGASLLGEVVAGTAEVDAIARGAPPNTDDDGRIETLAVRSRYLDPRTADRLAAELVFEGAPSIERIFGEGAARHAGSMAERCARAGNDAAARAWLALLGETAEKHRRLGDLALRRGDTAAALLAWDRALEIDPQDREVLARVIRARKTLEER